MGVGYAVAFLGGLATLFSPCSAMLLPSFFAYAFTARGVLLGRVGICYLGLLTTLVPLGVAAGGLGGLLLEHRAALVRVVALLIIALGLVEAAGIGIRLSVGTRGRRDPTGVLSIYLLGCAYGVAGVCSGPILGSVLAVAALGGQAAYGGALLTVYAAGMILPVVLLAFAWERFGLGRAAWLRPRPVRIGRIDTTVANLTAGFLLIAVGVLLVVTDGTTALAGVVDVTTQQAIEARIRDAAAHIPDLAVLAGIAVAAGVTGLLFTARRNRSRVGQT